MEPAIRRHPGAERATTLRDSGLSALLAGLVGVAVLVAVTVPFMARYGWDRDELYFLSAAHHLALGYVDFPPLIAVLGWFIDKLAPDSLLALRIATLAAGAATVVIVAFIARELGGKHKAQWIAALGWALAPYVLGSASIFIPPGSTRSPGSHSSTSRPACWSAVSLGYGCCSG